MRIIPLIAMLASAASLSANPDDRQDITLRGGELLKGARIVAIGDETASIVHSGGAVNVPVEMVPLDILARAHMRIEEESKEQERERAALEKKLNANTTAAKARKENELRVRLAMASVREKASNAATDRTSARREREIARLKAIVPKHPDHASPDPAIRDCIRKYTSAFSQINAATLSQHAKWIRSNIERDIDMAERTIATTRGGRATRSMNHAATKNRDWMESLLQHLAAIEAAR